MLSLPTEIVSFVCAIACEHDRKSAQSLSLTSKFIHDVSQPFAFSSLSISGVEQLPFLIRRLGTKPPPHRRGVQHLFFSDWTKDQIERYSDGANVEESELGPRSPTADIQRLLTLVAPHLRTLTFLALDPVHSTTLLAHLFSTKFPHLTKLTVYGLYPFPQPRSGSCPPTMPNLTTLHLVGNRNPHGLFQMRSLDAMCPRLRDLRISGVVGALSFAKELECAYLASREQEGGVVEKEEVFKARFPGRLERVSVQPGPPPRRPPRKQGPTIHERMMGAFELMQKLDAVPLKTSKPSLPVARFELLDQDRDGTGSSHAYDSLKADWHG